MNSQWRAKEFRGQDGKDILEWLENNFHKSRMKGKMHFPENKFYFVISGIYDMKVCIDFFEYGHKPLYEEFDNEIEKSLNDFRKFQLNKKLQIELPNKGKDKPRSKL